MPQEFHMDLSCYSPTQYATVTPKLFTFGSFFFFFQDNVLLISNDVISKSYKTTNVKINAVKPIKKNVLMKY